jgi:hypothetical protein
MIAERPFLNHTLAIVKPCKVAIYIRLVVGKKGFTAREQYLIDLPFTPLKDGNGGLPEAGKSG